MTAHEAVSVHTSADLGKTMVPSECGRINLDVAAGQREKTRPPEGRGLWIERAWEARIQG